MIAFLSNSTFSRQLLIDEVKRVSVSLDELKKAVESLKIALELHNQSQSRTEDERKAFRDACIQRFEYCLELSWKISMKQLGSTTVATKPAIREMARSNLIKNPEVWFSFVDARNETSHSYDENIAQKVFKKIEAFFPEVLLLVAELEKQK